MRYGKIKPSNFNSNQSALIELVRDKYPSLRTVPPSDIAGMLSIASDFHPSHVAPKAYKHEKQYADAS
jgi:hypothetical protein